LRVARGLPEGRCNLILVPDQGRDPEGALPTQVLLSGAHKRQTDATAAVLAGHCEAVHIPPPAIPRGDQHTHKRAAGISDKQASGRLAEQPLDILDPVSSACMRAARTPPQVEDRRRVGGPSGAYGVLLLAQAETVADVALYAGAR
jgi:hypothetical protein